MKEFLAKRKVHLIFGTGLLFILAFNVISGFKEGQTIWAAIWKGLSAERPMDYLMFVLFWYGAVHPPKDGWHTSLISLNLSRPQSEK